MFSERLRGMRFVAGYGLLVAVALALAGCAASGHGQSSPPTTTAAYCSPAEAGPPCGPGATVGSAYPFTPFTHCGILGAYFDGRFWRAAPPLSDGSGNPPRGWKNPSDTGTIRLVSHEVAQFRSDGGLTARFVPGRVKFWCD